MRPRPSRLVLASLTLASLGSAQARPGQRIVADLRVASITRSADTTIVSYRIHIAANSAEGLYSFTLNGTGVPLRVLAPAPTATIEWAAGTEHRGRAVAQWVLLGASPKGDSTPLLIMKGVGLPGVTTGWIQGEGLPSTNEEDPDAKADEPGDVDPIVYNGLQREVVGIDPLPTPSNASYMERLRRLSARACLNDWITSATLCTRLQGLSSAGPARVPDFLTAVETGNAAGHMNSLAYWMHKMNGEAARDFLQRR